MAWFRTEARSTVSSAQFCSGAPSLDDQGGASKQRRKRPDRPQPDDFRREPPPARGRSRCRRSSTLVIDRHPSMSAEAPAQGRSSILNRAGQPAITMSPPHHKEYACEGKARPSRVVYDLGPPEHVGRHAKRSGDRSRLPMAEVAHASQLGIRPQHTEDSEQNAECSHNACVRSQAQYVQEYVHEKSVRKSAWQLRVAYPEQAVETSRRLRPLRLSRHLPAHPQRARSYSYHPCPALRPNLPAFTICFIKTGGAYSSPSSALK